MQKDEVLGAADALTDVATLITDTTRDMHQAIAGGGFDRAARWVGPVVRPFRAVQEVLTNAVYASVRGGLSAGFAAGGRIAAALTPSDAPSITDQPRGSQLVGVVNGIIGDRLAEQGNPLAFALTLRHDGRELPPTREALAAAHPEAGGRIAVFVTGLCETEAAWRHRADQWHPNDPPTHGDRLHRDLGMVPLWVRYNTGRRVSVNGGELDALLAAVVRNWPVAVEEVVLVGYSMGGLVVRSALHQAAAHGKGWTRHVSHAVSLGAPHHGTPLEKFGHATTWTLLQFRETEALGTFFNRRSAGIKDLRYGNVTDADWVNHHPDALLGDTRVHLDLIDGTRHHALGAAIAEGRLGHFLGDLMVRLPSATGRHPHRTLPFHRQVELAGLNHLALLNHPTVYEHLLHILAADSAHDSASAAVVAMR